MSSEVRLLKVRMPFANLFTPKPFEPGSQPRYSASFLVEPGSDNDKRIKAAIKEAAKIKWEKKADANLASVEGNNNKYCYTDGNKKADYDGYAGLWVLGCNRRTIDGPPDVRDRDGKTQLRSDDGKPYPGCYVNAVVDFWAQDPPYLGIRSTVIAVQFHSDGDAMGGARRARGDEFEDLGVDDDDMV